MVSFFFKNEKKGMINSTKEKKKEVCFHEVQLGIPIYLLLHRP